MFQFYLLYKFTNIEQVSFSHIHVSQIHTKLWRGHFTLVRPVLTCCNLGNNPPQPEPEPLDLPDDLQLDDGEQNDKDAEGEEDNPFEIDNMKGTIDFIDLIQTYV